jgi:single-strand DNA-binding protein
MASAASQNEDKAATGDERRIERRGSTAKYGNLASVPELHYKDNKAWCRFRLAVEQPKEAGKWTGERVTEFFQVVCFNSLAVHVAQSLTKGARAVVVGRGEVEHWVADDGQPRTSERIVADAVGPDLRWATVVVEKVASGKAAEPGVDVVREEEPF